MLHKWETGTSKHAGGHAGSKSTERSILSIRAGKLFLFKGFSSTSQGKIMPRASGANPASHSDPGQPKKYQGYLAPFTSHKHLLLAKCSNGKLN